MKKRKLIFGAVISSQFILSCAHKEMPSQSASTSGMAPSATSREPSGGGSYDNPWTTWSDKNEIAGLYALSGIRKKLLHDNLHDPHVGYIGYQNERKCNNGDLRYRSADGTCNDLANPLTGAAGVAFGRNVPPSYIPGDADKKLMQPNPSLVSKEFFTRDEFKPVPFLNMLAAVWIQFMNHDWFTHGPNMVGNEYKFPNAEGQNIVVDRTAQNPNQANTYKGNYKKVTANDVTHWWDGSQIYGSNLKDQLALRTMSDGMMKLDQVNGHAVLPKAENYNPADNRQNHGQELTGFRDNWWLGLSMMHTLFVKEHNHIAKLIKKERARYDEKRKVWVWTSGVNGSRAKPHVETIEFTDAAKLDEHIFQVARLINTAIMAKIHTVEWTPAILPNNVLRRAMYTNWYGLMNPNTLGWKRMQKLFPNLYKTDVNQGVASGYVVGGIVGDKTNNYGVPFSITEEFVSVYRLHSLLPESLELRTLASPNKIETVGFADARNDKSYDLVVNNQPKDLFYSFGLQHPGQIVLNNFPKFMQDLQIPGHPNMDLGMMDVLRDRERGVPRYNQFRKAIGLKEISSYEDFFKSTGREVLDNRQQAIVEKFRRVYGVTNGKDNVNDIDLLVGTLSEDPSIRPENFGFGETQFHIFVLMASRRLMADRFFTNDYRPEIYTTTGMKYIDDEGTLAQVIVRHMPELAGKVKGLRTAFNPWNK